MLIHQLPNDVLCEVARLVLVQGQGSGASLRQTCRVFREACDTETTRIRVGHLPLRDVEVFVHRLMCAPKVRVMSLSATAHCMNRLVESGHLQGLTRLTLFKVRGRLPVCTESGLPSLREFEARDCCDARKLNRLSKWVNRVTLERCTRLCSVTEGLSACVGALVSMKISKCPNIGEELLRGTVSRAVCLDSLELDGFKRLSLDASQGGLPPGIRTCVVRSGPTWAFDEVLRGCVSLEHLEVRLLTSLDALRDDDDSDVSDTLSSFTRLRRLVLEGCFVGTLHKIGVEYLERLSLVRCGVTMLGNELRYATRLCDLDLDTEFGSLQHDQLFMSGARLRHLRLNATRLGLSDLIGNCGMRIHRLTRLSMWSCAGIGECLDLDLDTACPSLRRLELGACDIEVLRVPTRVHTLTVSHDFALTEIQFGDLCETRVVDLSCCGSLSKIAVSGECRDLKSITISMCPLLDDIRQLLGRKVARIVVSHVPKLQLTDIIFPKSVVELVIDTRRCRLRRPLEPTVLGTLHAHTPGVPLVPNN